MTPAPMTEVVLVSVAGLVAAWVVTYFAHSTLIVALALFCDRTIALPAIDRARLWRFAIVSPFLTAAVQTAGVSPLHGAALNVAPLLPQALVDWRLGAIAVSLLALAGTAAAGPWVTGSIVRNRLLGRRRLATGPLREEVWALATRIGCRQPRVTVSFEAAAPAAVGLAEVCVPMVSLTGLSTAERRALLAHEVAHVAARYPVWLAVAGSLVRIGAFQPLNRLALSRLREATEHAADDVAVRIVGEPSTVARALSSLAAGLLILPGGASASGSPLVARVRRLLDARATRAVIPPWRRRSAVALMLVTMVAVLPGVQANPVAVANRLEWLAPSRMTPNSRMLEVRRVTRDWRDAVRRVLR